MSLVPLDDADDLDEAILVGSEIAKEKPFLIQGETGEFIEDCPEGYYLLGFWGHGVNSYAFYYSLVDAWRRIFFRLPYGGVYMDNEEMAELIRKFLTAYLAFEQHIKDKVASLIAVESIGSGYYKIIMPEGKEFELEQSLFDDPDFQEELGNNIALNQMKGK